ncbi:NAD-dependent epimerase/dehydratase family protein [bacterium]|nr:NAD-dependent epimerase/dehydratase family protein [bacterium]
MKVLVTGSAGFIASSLIPKLKAAGHSIIGVDSLVSGSKNHKFTSDFCDHHFFDIVDADKLISLLNGVDVVFHLAAKGNVVESVKEPLENFNANVVSTLSLLEAMRHSNCKKIIFSSTGGALMGNALPPVSELTIPKPISPYGASKLACEGYLSAYTESYGFSSIILRFGNVYGPFSSHKVGVTNTWIRSSIEGRKIIIYGDGSSSRDYIHVDDLSDGLIQSFLRIQSMGDSRLETYHLANHQEVTLNQLKDILIKIIPDNSSLDVEYRNARPGEVSRNFADTSLARSKLGFSPQIIFSNGISDLYHWIKKHER